MLADWTLRVDEIRNSPRPVALPEAIVIHRRFPASGRPETHVFGGFWAPSMGCKPFMGMRHVCNKGMLPQNWKYLAGLSQTIPDRVLEKLSHQTPRLSDDMKTLVEDELTDV